MRQGLGTQLRHLLELLDGAVQRSYAGARLRYRPRYTPVLRALIERPCRSISEIAEAAGITQPAATQTVALMAADGLVEVGAAGHDGRIRLVRLSRRGVKLVPELQASWAATERAAAALDDEMGRPLSDALAEAIRRLEARSFDERIRDARAAALQEARR